MISADQRPVGVPGRRHQEAGVHRTGVVGGIVVAVVGAVVGLGAFEAAPAITVERVHSEVVQAAQDIFLEIKGVRGE
jgi:hypothetical protein